MRSRLPLLALLCTAQLINVLDVNAVLVALPVIGRDLGLAGGALQWVVTAYVLVFAGCLLVAGRLADLLGRRRVFGAGVALFTAASLGCGVAWSPEVLVLARGAQGLGAALTAPAALAMLVEASPAGHERERAVAVWTAVAAAGGAAGLVLGGLIAGGVGWRWVFLVNVPVGLAALALTPRLLPASRPGARPGGLDLAGAAVATGGLALLVFALARAEQEGLAVLPAVALAGAVLLLTTFGRRERHARHPLVPPTLLRRGPLVTALAAATLLTAATSGGSVLATLHLQDVLGLGPARAGIVLLPLSVTVVAGSAAAARVPVSPRTTIAAGLALIAAGAGCAAAGMAAGAAVAGLLAWGALAGLGLGAASVAATTLGTSAAGTADRGAASGLLNTAAQVGTAVGVASLVLVASAADGAAGHRIGFITTAGLALAGAAVPVLARARMRARWRAAAGDERV
jgi:MFS family permease